MRKDTPAPFQTGDHSKSERQGTPSTQKSTDALHGVIGAHASDQVEPIHVFCHLGRRYGGRAPSFRGVCYARRGGADSTKVDADWQRRHRQGACTTEECINSSSALVPPATAINRCNSTFAPSKGLSAAAEGAVPSSTLHVRRRERLGLSSGRQEKANLDLLRPGPTQFDTRLGGGLSRFCSLCAFKVQLRRTATVSTCRTTRSTTRDTAAQCGATSHLIDLEPHQHAGFGRQFAFGHAPSNTSRSVPAHQRPTSIRALSTQLKGNTCCFQVFLYVIMMWLIGWVVRKKSLIAYYVAGCGFCCCFTVLPSCAKSVALDSRLTDRQWNCKMLMHWNRRQGPRVTICSNYLSAVVGAIDESPKQSRCNS